MKTGIDYKRYLTPQSENLLRIQRDILYCRYPHLAINGCLGCGKTLNILYVLHTMACLIPGLKVCIVRNEFASFQATIFNSYKWMLRQGFAKTKAQPFEPFGGSVKPSALLFDNGSEIIFAGLDDTEKIYGAEFGIIFFNQADRLAEKDFGDLQARLRGSGAFLSPFTGEMETMFISDMNPSHKQHWILKHRDLGLLTLKQAHLTDNIAFFKDADWTRAGADYKRRFDISFPNEDFRRRRMVYGEFCSAEGVVYPFDPDVHVEKVSRDEIPDDYRWIGAIDFGIVNAASYLLIAYSPDKKSIVIFKELYLTNTTSHEMIPMIQALHNKYRVGRYRKGEYRVQVVCETAGDGKQTLERGGLWAKNAKKDVAFGIDVVHEFFVGADGKELCINADSLEHSPDQQLINQNKPTRLAEELLEYAYPDEDKQKGSPRDDLPVKNGRDNACDALRYGIVDIVSRIKRAVVEIGSTPVTRTQPWL